MTAASKTAWMQFMATGQRPSLWWLCVHRSTGICLHVCTAMCCWEWNSSLANTRQALHHWSIVPLLSETQRKAALQMCRQRASRPEGTATAKAQRLEVLGGTGRQQGDYCRSSACWERERTHESGGGVGSKQVRSTIHRKGFSSAPEEKHAKPGCSAVD